jgi:hypothetical protein
LLRERTGDAFQIVDHWEADRRAIGLAACDDASQLAHVLSLGLGHFHVSLETAPLQGSSLLYEEIGRYDAINREQILAILTQHLGLAER